MSQKEFQSIKINGSSFEGEAISNLCQKKLGNDSAHAWEKYIFEFILELRSDQNFINVRTSGSTGQSKSIKLPKDVLIHSAKATAESLDLKKGMNALLCLSAEFIAGKMMIVRAFINGLNLICVEPDSDPLKSIKIDIDFAAMIPLQVAHSLEFKKEKLASIRNLIIGGGRIDPKLHEKLIDFPYNVYATFGMTETATHIALKKLNTQNPNEYYQCLSGIKISETTDHCLLIQAPYISDQEIKTNDIVKIITETEFEVLGRKDNIINTGGIKIIPEELEVKISVFIEKNVFVTSITDEVLGEKIVLLIENGKINLNLLYRIWTDLDSNLNKHEIPKKIDFMSSFKYTKSGKINRSMTKKIYLDQKI